MNAYHSKEGLRPLLAHRALAAIREDRRAGSVRRAVVGPRGQELREPLLTGRPARRQLLELGRQVCDSNRLMRSILRCPCGCLWTVCGVHGHGTAAGWLTIDGHGLHPIACKRTRTWTPCTLAMLPHRQPTGPLLQQESRSHDATCI